MKRNYDFKNAKRGAVLKTPPEKTRITIRIDDDVLEWFRHEAHAAGGGSYQAMINAALRGYIGSEEEPLEETLRRVLKEVLPNEKRKTRTTAKKARKKARAS